MLIPIYIFLFIQLVLNQPALLNITASIQIQSQTYFSYLPFIETCKYNNTSMMEGKIYIKQITQKVIFQRIVESGVLSFWGGVKNGLDIALALDLRSTNYEGYILYDSVDEYFNRQIIFYDLNVTQLLFYYSLVTIDIETLQINISIQNQTQVLLTQQAQQLLQDCRNYMNQSNFAYIGNGQFLFVCGQFSKGFIFTPGLLYSQVTLLSFSQLGDGQYQLASNPILFDNIQKIYNETWNCALLFTNKNKTNLYFISDINQTFNITPLKNEIKTIKLLINRVWGEQARVQFIRLMNLYSSLNFKSGIYFPGNISTVFVSEEGNIFVESTTQLGVTYLCVFNNYGDIYWNLTINGSVIYYGNQILMVYEEQTNRLFKIQVRRPIYLIKSSDFTKIPTPGSFTNTKTTIICQSANITVNYTIFWSSIEFPAAFIKKTQHNPIYSNDSIHAIQTLQRFLIIGPDFVTLPSPPKSVEIFVINSKDVTIQSKAIAVFNAGQYSSKISGIIVVTNTEIVFVATDGNVISLVKEPCGFTSITEASIPTLGQCILTNSQGQICVCSQDFSSCSKLEQNINQESPSEDGQKRNKNQNTNNITDIFQQGPVLIKKIMYQLMDRGAVVFILTNNDVIFYDFANKSVLYNITFNCPKQNITNGIIYTEEFYRPIIALYCQGSSQLYQYIIESTTFIFQRIVPLYGFRTTKSFNGIQQTNNFVFVEVKPKIQTDQFGQNCCVLKLNLLQFTVSVIQEVIYAQYLLMTDSYDSYNFVITQKLQLRSQTTLIKIILPNQWLSFNQTDNSQLVTKHQSIPLYFTSPFYNFDFISSLSITFNLTNVQLNLISSPDQINVVYFKIQYQQEYKYILSYDMGNFVCGPIFNSFLYNTQKFKDISVTQTDTLLPFKIIGDPKITFIQIINPFDWHIKDLTLNNLLLCVSQRKMYVFIKYINDTQTIPLYNFSLAEKSCNYYLYDVLNNSAVSLISNCDGIDTKLQTPLLTISYRPKLNIFTHDSTYMEIPVALRSIETIHVNASLVYIAGILEGPLSSSSGRLVLCYEQDCSAFEISSNLQFLIDFSSFQSRDQDQNYFVFAIGTSIMDIFINPVVQTNKTSIKPNFSIQYTQFINQSFCSAMVILNATLSYSESILSCSYFYYYLSIDYNLSKIKVLNMFARYSQCNLFDEFKPQYIYQNHTLQMFFTQCRQNDYKTALDAYLGVKRSNVINTGYLQIFSVYGPKGPGCANNSRSPIRIIALSSSMDRPVFMVYKVGPIYKFLYSEVDGVLIDNLVQTTPLLNISFNPAFLNNSFPEINLIAFNQFHSLSHIYKTGKQVQPKNKYIMEYFIFGLYVLANFITVIFGLAYFIVGRNEKKQRPVSELIRVSNLQYFQTNRQTFVSPSQYSVRKNRHSSVRSGMTAYYSNGQQIQMHFIKPIEIKNQDL